MIMVIWLIVLFDYLSYYVLNLTWPGFVEYSIFSWLKIMDKSYFIIIYVWNDLAWKNTRIILDALF